MQKRMDYVQLDDDEGGEVFQWTNSIAHMLERR